MVTLSTDLYKAIFCLYLYKAIFCTILKTHKPVLCLEFVAEGSGDKTVLIRVMAEDHCVTALDCPREVISQCYRGRTLPPIIKNI